MINNKFWKIIIISLFCVLITVTGLLVYKYFNYKNETNLKGPVHIFDDPNIKDDLDKGIKRRDVLVGEFIKGELDSVYIKLPEDKSERKFPIVETFSFICYGQEIQDVPEFNFNQIIKIWKITPDLLDQHLAGEKVLIILSYLSDPLQINTIVSAKCPDFEGFEYYEYKRNNMMDY